MNELAPRLIRSGVLAAGGTLLLQVLGTFLLELIGSAWDLMFCALGAFISGLVFVRPDEFTVRGNLFGATGVVFVTFAFISAGHGMVEVYARPWLVDLAAEFLQISTTLFFWATLLVSWWLVPGVAVVLMLTNRFLLRGEGGERVPWATR